ncbi:tetratricopeptide repeat protein [Pelomonas sp. SE-A7]|uniref:tetratricopeptide repeat protein n=1 Tax=Pelomonas sp. SE-A7 TaxID=3054953 RepID=UPI00259CC437|nr:tetratricopeptide repeat protein [Pelomonas sp. SE-A7]MDM4768411.1 tetratricopeptide repeat protein [Pelomonas sp. SE-A7]
MGSSIQALIDQADERADEGDFEAALELFEQALEQVPEPWGEQEQALGLLVSIADMQFLLDDYESARDTFQAAVNSFEEAGEDLLVQLRLGQSLLELGEEAAAAEWLAAAFKAGGAKAFECEDPKYLAFVQARG